MNLVPIQLLKPHPKNNEYYDDLTGEKYEEVKRSIEIHGIRDPLKITPDYTVIAGHQRLRIAKELGIEKVPVVILDVSPEEAEYLLIADNEERRQGDSDPIKKARRAKFLKEYWGIKDGNNQYSRVAQNGPPKTLKNVAETIDESLTTTKRLIKLNDLIPELQSLVSSGKLGTTAAEQLAYLSPEAQRALWNTLGEEIGAKSVAEAKEIRKRLEAAEKALTEAQAQAKAEAERAAELERQVVELMNRPAPEPKVIERPPADYELIKHQKQKYQSENEVLKAELAMYKKKEKDRAKWAAEKMERLKGEAYTFEAEVNAFLEKVAVYGYLADQISTADDVVKQHYNRALEKLDQFISDMRFKMRGNRGIVIDYREV